MPHCVVFSLFLLFLFVFAKAPICLICVVNCSSVVHSMSGLFMDLGKLTPSFKIVCTNLLSFFFYIPVLNNCSILHSVQIISVLKLSGHFPVFSCLNDSLCFLSGFLRVVPFFCSWLFLPWFLTLPFCLLHV